MLTPVKMVLTDLSTSLSQKQGEFAVVAKAKNQSEKFALRAQVLAHAAFSSNLALALARPACRLIWPRM